MSGAEEEWVKSAMTDDTMVVELLVRLHSASPPPPLPKPVLLPLEWSVRQRRSNPKKLSQRGSPTTPLSWSAATSLSGGSGGAAAGGGYEESSQPLPPTTARSKLQVNGDIDKTGLKRSRKKKTLAELKDEENSMLKERRELKREIAALRVNLEKQRSMNENLKRMKIELQPLPDRETTSLASLESIPHQLQQKTTTVDHPIPLVMPSIVSDNNDVTLQSSSSNNCPEQNTVDPKFVLPDLNLAFEEAISGVS